eukprot:TRINITY_DN11051_c0_g2_i1.p1 TRINITY_DN11051_c0_g2~~TRINITY_DN11051_c0_g2_i1.p1  ORF type:complete len:205 (-),score=42.09 TRINITY_DN11051_c0_g2_i1:16-549(-)
MSTKKKLIKKDLRTGFYGSGQAEEETEDEEEGNTDAITNNTIQSRTKNFIWLLSKKYYEMDRGPENPGGFNMCDTIAVLAAIIPGLITGLHPAFVSVELAGNWSRGMTVVDWSGQWVKDQKKNVEIITGVDKERLRAVWEELLQCSQEIQSESQNPAQRIKNKKKEPGDFIFNTPNL